MDENIFNIKIPEQAQRLLQGKSFHGLGNNRLPRWQIGAVAVDDSFPVESQGVHQKGFPASIHNRMLRQGKLDERTAFGQVLHIKIQGEKTDEERKENSVVSMI